MEKITIHGLIPVDETSLLKALAKQVGDKYCVDLGRNYDKCPMCVFDPMMACYEVMVYNVVKDGRK